MMKLSDKHEWELGGMGILDDIRELENNIAHLEAEKKHWWILACQRFASLTKAREILGNIEAAPFKDEKEVDGAIQEAHDILGTLLTKATR